MSGRLLETMTWVEAEVALHEVPVVLIPLGARLKEHGHHLPLNNDWLMAEYLARRVMAESPVLVTPTVQYNYYPALINYAGSISIGLETSAALVADICRSLARHGGQRFYVLNTGVSTNQPLEMAREHLAAEGIKMQYLHLLDAMKEPGESVRQQQGGTHADELETSMMLYLAPDVVQMDKAVPDYHPRMSAGPLTRDPNATTGVYSPTGAWGDPTLATVEKGRVVVEALVKWIIDEVRTLAAA
jgi:creatinine amidohydrolase